MAEPCCTGSPSSAAALFAALDIGLIEPTGDVGDDGVWQPSECWSCPACARAAASDWDSPDRIWRHAYEPDHAYRLTAVCASCFWWTLEDLFMLGRYQGHGLPAGLQARWQRRRKNLARLGVPGDGRPPWARHLAPNL